MVKGGKRMSLRTQRTKKVGGSEGGQEDEFEDTKDKEREVVVKRGRRISLKTQRTKEKGWQSMPCCS